MKSFGFRNKNIKNAVLLFGLGTIVDIVFSMYVFLTLYGLPKDFNYYALIIFLGSLYSVLAIFFLRYLIVLIKTPSTILTYYKEQNSIIIKSKFNKKEVFLKDILSVRYIERQGNPNEPLPGSLILTLKNKDVIKVHWLGEINYTAEFIDKQVRDLNM